MNYLTLVAIVAMLATIAALTIGIFSMVRDGEIAHLDSEHWMATRVCLQATAVVALVAAYYVAG